MGTVNNDNNINQNNSFSSKPIVKKTYQYLSGVVSKIGLSKISSKKSENKPSEVQASVRLVDVLKGGSRYFHPVNAVISGFAKVSSSSKEENTPVESFLKEFAEYFGENYEFPVEDLQLFSNFLSSDSESLELAKSLLSQLKDLQKKEVSEQDRTDAVSKALELFTKGSVYISSLDLESNEEFIASEKMRNIAWIEPIQKALSINTQDFTDLLLLGAYDMKTGREKDGHIKRFYSNVYEDSKNYNAASPYEKALVDDGYIVQYTEGKGKHKWVKNEWIKPDLDSSFVWKNVIGYAQPGGDVLEFAIEIDLSEVFQDKKPSDQELLEAFSFLQDYISSGEKTRNQLISSKKELFTHFDALLSLAEKTMKEAEGKLEKVMIAFGDPRQDVSGITRRSDQLRVNELEKLSGHALNSNEKDSLREVLSDPEIFNRFKMLTRLMGDDHVDMDNIKIHLSSLSELIMNKNETKESQEAVYIINKSVAEFESRLHTIEIFEKLSQAPLTNEEKQHFNKVVTNIESYQELKDLATLLKKNKNTVDDEVLKKFSSFSDAVNRNFSKAIAESVTLNIGSILAKI